MFIPSSTRVTQAGSSRPPEPCSTRHSRQAPTSDVPARWQRVGIVMPASRAASRIVCSARALVAFPLIVSVLTAMD